MSLKREVFKTATSVLRWAGRRGDLKFYSSMVRTFHKDLIQKVGTRRGELRFYCPSETACWRADTLLTKEPETIEWIDSFKPGDCLWDIGANVGMYTLYAALIHRVHVLAFEPASANYFVLCQNVELNGMDERVSALCLAFSDADSVSYLNMRSTDFASSLHSFGVAEDHKGTQFQPTFRQSVIGYSIDSFVRTFAPEFPTHIKIDVDGIEDRIIVGAQKTLNDPRLRSVSVELVDDHPLQVETVLNSMSRAGLRLLHKKQGPMAVRQFESTFNYLFVKD